MQIRNPVAFLSYVHSDDEHDGGKITRLRQRLEGEIRMQLGRPFPIFQDRNDIAWGQKWHERIVDSILDVTFLIPVITPSFFHSHSCLFEFSTFAGKEQELGFDHLILPIYYVDCDDILGSFTGEKSLVAQSVKSRQWIDWRKLRHREFSEADVSRAISRMAEELKALMRKLEAELDAEQEARERTPSPSAPLETEKSKVRPIATKSRKKKKGDPDATPSRIFVLPSDPFSLQLEAVIERDKEGKPALFAHDVATSYISPVLSGEGRHEGRGIPDACWSAGCAVRGAASGAVEGSVGREEA